MPTKRLSINLTKPEDIKELKELAIVLQAMSKERYSYTDIVRMLVKFGNSYPSTILRQA
jgi:hypothetical protein